MSEVGPVLAGLELAARKLSALFSRAEARDFADVYVLCQQFERSEIIDCSRHIDLGINDVDLAEALQTIGRTNSQTEPLLSVLPWHRLMVYHLAVSHFPL